MQSTLAGLSEQERRRFMAVFHGDVDIAISLAIQTDNHEARRLALTKLMRRKGRIIDSMASDFAALRQHPDPEAQALLSSYREVLSRYSSELLRGPDHAQSSEQYRRHMARLRGRVQELEKQMVRHGRAPRHADTAVNVEAVQAAMRSDSVLVEWTRYQPNLMHSQTRYAASVLFKQGDPIWIDLGDSITIDNAVAGFRAALSNRQDNTLVLARKLDALIMEPVRERLGHGCHDLWLSPDGPLHLIPFAALLDRQGRYMVERHSFTYLTSGRDLLRMQRRVASRSPPVVVADPAYGDDPDGAFSRLPSAGAEARMIETRLPGTRVLTGWDASERNVMSVAGPRIFHVETHGYIEPRGCGNPPGWSADIADMYLLPGLALAGANSCHHARSGDDDGLLTAAEITAMDLHGTKLAVLSACETGRGATSVRDDSGRQIGLGEGVYGLRRALVLAGAETQMTSLWQVEDRSTYELMTGYYGKLLRGSGRSEALRETQLELLRRKPGLHPYYWSGFIVSGDSRPLDGGDTARSGATCERPRSPWSFHVGAQTLARLGDTTAFLGSRITLSAGLALPRGIGLHGSVELGMYGDESMFRRDDPARGTAGLGRLELGATYLREPILVRGGFDLHTGQARLGGRVDMVRGDRLRFRAAAGRDVTLSGQTGVHDWWRLSAALRLAGTALGAAVGTHERMGYGYLRAVDLSITRGLGRSRAYLDFSVPLVAQDSPHDVSVIFGVSFGAEHRNLTDPRSL